MKNSTPGNCEAASCEKPGKSIVLFGLLRTDVEHPSELKGPRYYSDRQFLCDEHIEFVRKAYVHVNDSSTILNNNIEKQPAAS